MKKALIIINVNKDESMDLAQEVTQFIRIKNIDSDRIMYDGFVDNIPFDEYDFVVTLGGDGMVLYAARNAVALGIPVFPINLGQFGFIAAIQPSEWSGALEDFLAGKSSYEERSMMNADVIRDGKIVYSSLGLNDVAISSDKAASIISLTIDYDKSLLCHLKGDGVIFATSTGSTAYSASAGGPIVDTHLDAFVMTPLNPFSLSSRPIVLSPDGNIEVQVEKSRTKEICVTVDGQEPFELTFGDIISIKKFEKNIKLISCTRDKFYKALRSKLNWSGGPHA